MPLVVLNCSGTKIRDLEPLREMRSLRKLYCSNTGVTTLAPLRELRLTTLVLNDLHLADLSPLEGMQLEELFFPGTRVADLRPLRQMKSLKLLSTRSTQVQSLEPLRGLPLEYLEVNGAVTDLAPVQGAPLRAMLLPPPVAVANRKVLHGIPTLKEINYRSVDKFWEEQDSKPPKE
jgi:Leucine-rich repeat (LRR) protein